MAAPADSEDSSHVFTNLGDQSGGRVESPGDTGTHGRQVGSEGEVWDGEIIGDSLLGETQDGGNGFGAPSDRLDDMLKAFDQSFVISDATSSDIPITFASEGFYRMTGFTPPEVIGKNCRFLQGPETDGAELRRLRSTIESGKTYSGRLLNYRKDGSTFWNLLTVCPIKDASDKIVKYIGMQVDVTKFTEGAASSAKRPNELPISLINYDARQKAEAASRASEILKSLNAVQPLSESQTHEDSSLFDLQETDISTKFSILNQILKPTVESTLLANDGEVLSQKKPTEENESKRDFHVKILERNLRRGIDLATTLERIQKSFVITDPRLPENPIIFVSDEFLELTEYSREEVLGKNCRFLQGKETSQDTVLKIRNAIKERQNTTVIIMNYKKSGKKFWNLFHLHLVKDNQGEMEYFIGIQLDITSHVLRNECTISEKTMAEGAAQIDEAAKDITQAVKEFIDPSIPANKLWEAHKRIVTPKPHASNNENWKIISNIMHESGGIELRHFRPIKLLGCGDTGSVYLAELLNTGKLFALKSMNKDMVIKKNKVQRVNVEREILELLDHPFLPALYTSFETQTHVYLVTDFCPGRELMTVLKQQPNRTLSEDVARFYAAEVLLALEYLHCKGVIYRDLKPENVLLTDSGHIVLTDFDLSLIVPTSSTLYSSSLRQTPSPNMSDKERKKFLKKEEKLRKREEKRRKKEGKRGKKIQDLNENPSNSTTQSTIVRKDGKNFIHFHVQPCQFTNSFVGTEEYIAPEIIIGVKHGVQVDWWSFGIFIYELLHGKTPFRGETRNETFNNILNRDCIFPHASNVSEQAKDLIRLLLNRDPTKRLGTINGAEEIKRHPFFRSIPWPFMRSTPAPIFKCDEETNSEVNPEFSDWDEVLKSSAEDVF